MSTEKSEDDHTVMLKTAFAIITVALILTLLVFIAGWAALVILSAMFLWVGVATITTNWALAIVYIIVGTIGLTLAAFIAVSYREY